MDAWVLPEASRLLDVMGRLALAAALGAVLGVEREAKGKAAGLRTHMLVALGAALFTTAIGDLERDETDADALARVVQGLAAGIWLTAAVGLAVAIGCPWIGVFGALLAVGITALLGRVELHSEDGGPDA